MENLLDKTLSKLRPYLRGLVFDQYENFYCRLHVVIPKSWSYDKMKEENLVLKYEILENHIFLVLGIDNNRYSDLKVDVLLGKLLTLIEFNKQEAIKAILLKKRLEQMQKMTLEEIQSLTLPDITIDEEELRSYDSENSAIVNFTPVTSVPVFNYPTQKEEPKGEVVFQELYTTPQQFQQHTPHQEVENRVIPSNQQQAKFQELPAENIQYKSFNEDSMFSGYEIVPDSKEEQEQYYMLQNMKAMKMRQSGMNPNAMGLETPDAYFSRRDTE